MRDIVSFIHIISMILSLAGVASIRLFTPVFLYMLLIRYGGHVGFLASGVARLQSMTPDWMNNDLIFVIVGVLAALEIAANWNSTLREFLADSKFENTSVSSSRHLSVLDFLAHRRSRDFKSYKPCQKSRRRRCCRYPCSGHYSAGL